ncbi:hypothetical protein Q8F55_005859 [Vanrija albida]|uniref:RWD domain-containing protein n=1 Tax=Vanrija albida TaxID=181172 RepID=A0ABR3Q2R1_9TREE
MADHQAILEEEFEVLESIFPDEFEKVSDNEVRIRIEPEEEVSGHPCELCCWTELTPVSLVLVVTYPPTYPDVIPELSLEEIDEELGELREGEEEEVVGQLNQVAEESLGMAMTFTIATAARETLSALINSRKVREQEEDEARARAYEEEEKKKTRGTPLTPALYAKWKDSFRAEMATKKAKQAEDAMRALPAREREDWRKKNARASGRQLFETAKVSATSDEALYEDGEAVDVSQYTREERDRARWEEEAKEEQAGHVALDDSDDE